MISKILSIGDRVEIALKRDNKSIKKTFLTRIIDFVNDNPNRFIISCPITYGKIIHLPATETYTLTFYTKTSVFTCDCKVVEQLKKGELHNTLMETTSEFEKTQRRQFFRYSCLIPFKFVKIDLNSDNATNQRVTMIDGIVKDLGGGGIRFIANDGLENEDFIQIVLPVNGEMIIAVGKIILKTAINSDSAIYKFEYRLKFNVIDRADQDKIVKFVLEEQRKYLQKTGIIKKH